MKKIHFLLAVLIALVLPLSALAATETVDGIEWWYFLSTVGGLPVASVSGIGDKALAGDIVIPSILGGYPVKAIASHAFNSCSNLTSVMIPDGVTSIGGNAFLYCSSLTSLRIPDGVSMGTWPFGGCHGLREIVFAGNVPEGLSGSGLPFENANCHVTYPEAYGAEWNRFFSDLNGTVMNYEHEASATVEILSAQMRATDPTILDVVYKVTSTNAKVNVRALAFEDGERSFAKVVRPETFVEGTGTNLGDGVAANVEHTVSWRVSADWAVDLAKVSFEILVSDVGQLPVELVTIPAAGTNAEMIINVRRPREDDIFNALLWHYADHAEDLTVVDGQLKQDGTVLARGICPENTTAPIAYVYDKMGYDLLTGEALEYARMATRWPLSTTGTGIAWVYAWHYNDDGAYVKEWHWVNSDLAYLQYGVLRTGEE